MGGAFVSRASRDASIATFCRTVGTEGSARVKKGGNLVKVVMCIAGQKIAPDLLEKLEQNNYRVTRLASEGGFLRRGNATYLIGVEDDEVSRLLGIVDDLKAQNGHTSSAQSVLAIVLDAEAGGAFVHTNKQQS